MVPGTSHRVFLQLGGTDGFWGENAEEKGRKSYYGRKIISTCPFCTQYGFQPSLTHKFGQRWIYSCAL